MLKIRLMRIGAKKKPFYRVVAVNERSKRTGGYVELLGTYNPLTEPKDIKLNKERIDYWIKQGAQPSTGYLRIIGKAPQRPPRKPKKAAKEAPAKPEAPAATPETAPSDQPVPSESSETPESAPAQETAPKSEAAPEVTKDETPVESDSTPADESAVTEPEKTEENK